ncbi:MAG: nucleotidyltransferase family protein [Cellulomonas sp.]|uniref:molybdenum cofactor guanylyltransferase n=1 Tax=Cellulomonas sp. TaxID=40001 RepID=UPI0019DA3B62|nr:nucleotidyltransferase family protein [Cellulomonas sp.]MBF0689792.1 nucleotidyltransferase family protein [Cellulomonas sp.]
MTPPPAFVVVLTGGTARRLGGVDKTALDVDGRPVLHRLLDDVGPLPVVVVGPAQDVGRDVVWTREDPPLGGPLAATAAGVTAGLVAHPAAEVVVLLAGDQPFAGVAVDALRDALACDDEVDAALAAGPDGRAQPLLAAYRLAAVRERLTGDVHGRPVRDLVRGLRTVLLPVARGTALDVDDAADLALARRLARGLSPGPDPTR